MNKITLHLIENRITSARPVELEADRILCNDITLPGDSNPHNTCLWVVGNEYGALGAVWADCEQDAFDELVDSGLGDGLLIDEADADEHTSRLGNAGEAADLDNAWIARVGFQAARDLSVLLKFAEARGADWTNLDN